jgi:CheY-like chemotaxis protein
LVPRIFNAFEQGGTDVTRSFGGLGLGLAISRAIVDLHGGRIRASSAGSAQGSTFQVALPLSIAAVPQPPAAHPAKDGRRDRSLRVLLVEDNADTLETMEELLSSRGMAVTTAKGIEEALTAASQATFDLMISDIGLPDGTGCELVERMRKSQPLPAIALSGYGMNSDVRRSLEAGFTAHLVKPVTLGQLEKAIADIL